jgi:hypothetical protein
MALPVFAKFYTQLNEDKTYNNYSQARFKPMKNEWSAELDCNPFKEDFKLFQWLFGKKKEGTQDEQVEVKEKEKEKKGLFQKLKKLFKKN